MENLVNPSDIAKRIKMLAKNKGVSIKKMLEDVGLGSNTMSNMKTSVPQADNLLKIANYFDCSVDYLLGKNPPLTIGIVNFVSLSLSHFETTILKCYNDLKNELHNCEVAFLSIGKDEEYEKITENIEEMEKLGLEVITIFQAVKKYADCQLQKKEQKNSQD